MVGNANLDIASTTHLHEVNIVLNSSEITTFVTDKVFTCEFNRAIKALPSSGTSEIIKHALGIRGLQEFLATKYKVQILDIIEESDGYKTFILDKPPEFNFFPGQYVNCRSGNSLNGMIIKPLLLAISSGCNENYIELTARSSFLAWNSNYCLNKKIGDYVEIEGPLGTHFPFENINNKKVLLIGGGSGITPLRSILKSVSTDISIKLLYSTKFYDNLLYKNDCEKWINFGHIICLTQEKRQYEKFQYQRVTKILETFELDYDMIFLCGSIDLIKDVINILINKKDVSSTNIFASLPIDALHGGPVYRGDHPIFNHSS